MEISLVLTDRGLRVADESALSGTPQPPIEPTAEYIADLIKKYHPNPDKWERIARLEASLNDLDGRTTTARETRDQISHLKFNAGPPKAEGVAGALAALAVSGAEVKVTRTAVSIVWRTEPITLQYANDGPRDADWGSGEVALGAFLITVVFDRGNVRVEAHAINPNPCVWGNTVTHPHVRDGKVCTGEGQRPLIDALLGGNLDLAKEIVDRIIGYYSSANPFARLSEWQGRRITCRECQTAILVDPNVRQKQCRRCGGNLCGDCGTACEGCGSVCCSQCLIQCRNCDVERCSGCLRQCSNCANPVCRDCRAEVSCCGHTICANCFPEPPVNAARPYDEEESDDYEEEEHEEESDEDYDPSLEDEDSEDEDSEDDDVVAF